MTSADLQLVVDLDWHKVQYPCFVEPKIDGFRCLVTVDDDGTVRAFSRSGREWPKVADALKGLSQFSGCWFDGEIQIGGSWAATNAAKNRGWEFDKADLLFWIFAGDAARLDPWHNCIKTPSVCTAENRRDVELAYKAAICAGFEGVVVKAINAPYTPGRSGNWMRIKPEMTVDYEINPGVYLEVKSDGTLLRVRSDK